MPNVFSFLRRIPLFPLCTGISLFVGLIIPSIFEFTEKPAARSRHYGLEKLAVATLLVTFIACLVIMWLRSNPSSKPIVTANERKLQFGLRQLFFATTLSAILLATTQILSPQLASLSVVGLVFAIIGWAFAGDWHRRSRIGAILVCMFMPFVWMIAYSVPIGRTSGLIQVLPLGPGIILAELIRALLSMDRDRAANLAIVFVFAQLLIGVWLARRGGKLPVVFATVVFITSSLSSFFFHAMFRM